MEQDRSRLKSTCKIAKLLKTKPIYCEETPSSIFIVLSKEQWAGEEIALNLEDTFKKKVKIVLEGDEEDLLVALYDNEEKFLSIGILQEIDYDRRVLKVYMRLKKMSHSCI